VTKAMREVSFLTPVFLGDLVTFYARVARVGTTSITVDVEVEVERLGPQGNRETLKVTEAVVTYVAVDANGRPEPIAQ
jgi:acyl-CoA thioesterase YciA